MRMRVLLTGADGQLGRALVRELKDARHELVICGREALDITVPAAVNQAVSVARPDWLINAAAYTQVDRAESDAEGAYLLNDAAVGFLADAAFDCGARFMHVSTDYVFSGEFNDGAPRPYREDDAPAPLSVYGASKLAGEERLARHPVTSVILRTSWLYDAESANFLTTIVRLARSPERGKEPLRVVNDQTGTPTTCPALARQMVKLLATDTVGLVHASAAGAATWWEFARAIFTVLKIDVQVDPIPTSAYPTLARRPAYSVLENARLGELGLDIMAGWQEELEALLWSFDSSRAE